MDEAKKRWEEAALARFAGQSQPADAPRPNGWATRGGWHAADRLLNKKRADFDTEHLLVVWLEHLASELQEEAVARNAIADHTGADRLMDESEAHLLSAKAIRVRLLGEESTDG